MTGSIRDGDVAFVAPLRGGAEGDVPFSGEGGGG